jgi:hypothetical protein
MMYETQPLLDNEDKLSSYSKVKKVGGVAALCLLGSSILYAAKSSTTTNKVPSTSTNLNQVKISVQLSNDYGLSSETAKDYSWIETGTLVEPYKITSLSVLNIPDDLEETDVVTTCTASHISTKEVVQVTSTGYNSCNLMFSGIGKYHLEVDVEHETLGNIGFYSTQLISRYVRRNLRKLNTFQIIRNI